MFLRNLLKNNIRYILNKYIPQKYKIFIGKLIRYIHSLVMYFTLIVLIILPKKFIKLLFIQV